MTRLTPQQLAGITLRKLIRDNYPSQEQFAYEFGADVRTINRYINEGINKISTVQEFAEFFQISFDEFFKETE